MSQTPSIKETFSKKLRTLCRQATDLSQKVEQEGATERDVAVAAELGQKYVDLLGELETADLEFDFSDEGEVASWIYR
jgi:hypothetical protein